MSTEPRNTTPTIPAVRPDRDNRWYLSSAPILSALVHLCIPMVAAMIVGAVYNVINAGFIGSLHDTALLAAVTLGAPVLGLVMGVGGVFGTGGGALVSRLLGASENDPRAADDIKHVGAFSVWGAAIVGLVLGVIGLALLDPLVALLGADADAADATRAFVGVLLAFVPVLAAAFCLEQLVRAEGAARQVLVAIIASTVANVVFDVLFVLVLGWGVAGAALAVGLANVVVVTYFAVWLARHSENLRVSPRWFTLAPRILRPVLGVGASELMQSGFLIVTALVLNNLAVVYGDGAIAAMGVAVRIAQVPEFLLMGITLGVLPLLAYAYGKGDRSRLSGAFRTSAIVVGGIGVLASVLLISFGEHVVSVFSSDTGVRATGVTVLTAQLVAMVAHGFVGLLISFFQATGRAVPAAVMSVTQGVLFIPVVILGNLWFGLAGIIWALTLTEVVMLLVGVGLWLALRRVIDRGLDAGSQDSTEEALTAA
ncbi:MATE family efflux transporter [Labedella endophytica]|uniref:MATE family efflux transporter n=1 Tax=Labedella endophytica TaxID=1523160 RepID=A0A3S0XQ88_9MICO|nr:MATE family efflux transporter [Labedella endophytica]RUR03083.1 MATE family efflux transporter [Labedella endophytica]